MRTLLSVALAGLLLAAAGTAEAADDRDLLREVLRQQAAAQQGVCPALLRALAVERSVSLVVRTAIEVGYTSCEVIRCAIEDGADLARILQGAGEAGVTADVAARCALEAGAEGKLVSRILVDLVFEPTFCYYTFSPVGTPEPLTTLAPVIDRAHRERPQASTFTF